MKLSVHRIPNLITALRIAGTGALLFLTPLTVPFDLLYLFTGVTDVLDGAIARATKTTSAFGAKLDSIADLLFYTVMLLKVFPALWQRLPAAVWYCAGGVLLLRLASYGVAAVKYRRFAALHTKLNKLTGLLVFTIPFLIRLPIAVPGCFTVAAVAAAAALEELAIHIRSKAY